jgi:hypothetical protein
MQSDGERFSHLPLLAHTAKTFEIYCAVQRAACSVRPQSSVNGNIEWPAAYMPQLSLKHKGSRLPPLRSQTRAALRCDPGARASNTEG